MTTFERVKRNILRDMDGQKVHTAESWANILLTNTNRLKDEREQAKFWAWLGNPDDREMEEPTLRPVVENKDAPTQVSVTVKDECDEKEGETIVELENAFERNGFITVCRTKPRN